MSARHPDYSLLAKENWRTCFQEQGISSANPLRLKSGGDLDLSEQAEKLLRACSGEVVYIDDFFRYDVTEWKEIPLQDMRKIIGEFDGKFITGPLSKVRVLALSSNRVDAILKETGLRLAHPCFFDERAQGINCTSGFIYFDTRGTPTLTPHSLHHRCLHTLPGRWQPGDPTTPPEGSNLRKLLNSFDGDEDSEQKKMLYQEILGAAALGNIMSLGQPKAFIFDGITAENGKSQCIDTACALLPSPAISHIPPWQMDKPEFLIGLRGKQLNTCAELTNVQAMTSAAELKMLITGDPIAARDLYKSRVEFRPTAMHIFATNGLPCFKDGIDAGLRRRLVVLRFDRTIPESERIPNLARRIGEEEADLLLAFAVEGASRLIRQGDFTIPASSIKAMGEWLCEADTVMAWFHECVEVSPVTGGMKTKSKAAYDDYGHWCVDNGYRPVKHNYFTRRVKQNAREVQHINLADGPYFRGMKLRR